MGSEITTMKKTGKVETIDMFPVENEIAKARREVMESAQGKGRACPCCDQFVKIYRRTINSTMARQLLTAYHKHGASKDGLYFHTRDVVLIDSSGAGDFSKLEYWGLIERQEHVQGYDAKRSSGMWRITSLGREFVLNRTAVPMYALVYNNKLLELKGPQIDMQHALGKKFDYNEIMGWTGASKSVIEFERQEHGASA